MPDDKINPPHYRASNGIESIQVIEGFSLNYNCGTAAAYIMRHQSKGGVEDLKKAVWHLQREIAAREVSVPGWSREEVAELHVERNKIAAATKDDLLRKRKRSRRK